MEDLSARPLLASALDADLFVDRERELETLERTAKARLNALVVGQRGVGKTSLLHQLERRLEGDPQLAPVFVQGARRAERPEELLSLLAYRLDDDRARFSHLGEIMQSVGGAGPPTSTEGLLAGLRTVREALAHTERRPLLILDELASGEVAQALFGQLRDELWSLPATWVVAAETGEQAGYLRPPASAFFETVVTVEPLAESEAIDLLRRRTADERSRAEVLRSSLAPPMVIRGGSSSSRARPCLRDAASRRRWAPVPLGMSGHGGSARPPADSWPTSRQTGRRAPPISGCFRSSAGAEAARPRCCANFSRPAWPSQQTSVARAGAARFTRSPSPRGPCEQGVDSRASQGGRSRPYPPS